MLMTKSRGRKNSDSKINNVIRYLNDIKLTVEYNIVSSRKLEHYETKR